MHKDCLSLMGGGEKMQNLHNWVLVMISDTHLQRLLAEEEQGSFVLRSTRQNQTTLLLQTI